MATTQRLLVLDEPLTGLDPDAIDGFHEAATQFVASGRGLLISTHLLREAEALATHVVILEAGRTVANGTLADVCQGRTLMDTFREVVRELPALQAVA